MLTQFSEKVFFLVVTISSEDEATEEELASSGSRHKFQKSSYTKE